MSSGEAIDRWLNSIPGYAGYRDKERRRDSDRAIREKLALDYGQLADKLGRLAGSLADQRKIMLVPVVDKPHGRLVSFIDRVRTASYGYAPLFSEIVVDADALDQLALFDRSLSDQQQVLSEQITALESADPDDPSFRTLAQAITDTVEGLHERFDRRNEVIQVAKPLATKDVVAYLEPARPATPPAAYRLHDREAVSYENVNYTVIGRVTVETDREAWRAFQLKGGTGDAWLLVSADSTLPAYWARRMTMTGNVGDQSLTLGGETYTLEGVVNGKGEVIGQSGAAGDQPVRLGRYRSSTGTNLLFAFDWDTGTLALNATEANPASLDIFTREQ